jgi:2-polyprenyl-3-methyl-5-hydroxy-6-metoxy-1,4-benzoquinol methylase
MRAHRNRRESISERQNGGRDCAVRSAQAPADPSFRITEQSNSMSPRPPPPALDFTGERFTPECVREIWYEHWHRYAFAMNLARGKRVLDAACGEGYGSALLAEQAASVLGLDIDPASVQHASDRYAAGRPSLEYRVADVTALELPPASFDLIVSFETLEHVEAQEQMLAGFARLLKPDGLLLISSPDKATYSDAQGHANPFHVRELYRAELEALLDRHFPARRLLAQKLVFQSLLWDVDQVPRSAHPQYVDAQGRVQDGLGCPSLYYLAICAHRAEAMPQAGPALWSFGDAAESVYAHYNQEIRNIIAAGHRIIAMDAEIKQLRSELAACRAAPDHVDPQDKDSSHD